MQAADKFKPAFNLQVPLSPTLRGAHKIMTSGFVGLLDFGWNNEQPGAIQSFQD